MKMLILALFLSYSAGVAASDIEFVSNAGFNQQKHHIPLQVASINENYFRFTTINNFLDTDFISKLINEDAQSGKDKWNHQPLENKNNTPIRDIQDEPQFNRDQK